MLAVALAVAGCRTPPPRGPRLVRIAAASDLRYAFEEIQAGVKRAQPDLEVRVSYGSSGSFHGQIQNGAPFDLFLSADVRYPIDLASRGLAVPGSEFIYAIGRLAIWTPASAPIDIATDGMKALADPRVERVAIANPAHAPYGRAAEAAMRHAGLYEALAPRLVLGENVAQAMQFVQSGSAQAGFVALSLAAAPEVGGGKFWEVPADWFPRLEQGGVILANAADVEGARAVRAFLLSEPGRAILKRFSFNLPEPK